MSSFMYPSMGLAVAPAPSLDEPRFWVNQSPKTPEALPPAGAMAGFALPKGALEPRRRLGILLLPTSTFVSTFLVFNWEKKAARLFRKP